MRLEAERVALERDIAQRDAERDEVVVMPLLLLCELRGNERCGECAEACPRRRQLAPRNLGCLPTVACMQEPELRRRVLEAADEAVRVRAAQGLREAHKGEREAHEGEGPTRRGNAVGRGLNARPY